MWKRYGSRLLLFWALAILALIALRLPVRRTLSNPVPRHFTTGHYIRRGGDTYLDINAATLDELMELPGIGQTGAARILQYREASGHFSHIEELMEVEGIGEGTFAIIAPYIAVSP